MSDGSAKLNSGTESKETSLPKQKLIEFLQNSVAEEAFTLVIPSSAKDAATFIHRMRVELSRFREQVRNRGRVPRAFKMLYIKTETKAINENTCSVVLMKSTSGHAVDAEIDAIFEQVAGGTMLEVDK